MSEKIKYAVMVSGGGTNLQAIIDAQAAGKIPHGELALVLSNVPDAYALERAKKAGIPAVAITKKGFTDHEAYEEEMIRQLDAAGIEFIVLAGFLAILSEDFVKHYERRMINIHPSLIPSFCGEGFYGLKVHEAALAKGVKVSGATVHFVNEIPDGGEIILQKAVRVFKNDTPEKLQLRIMKQAEWKLLPRATELCCKELAKAKAKKKK